MEEIGTLIFIVMLFSKTGRAIIWFLIKVVLVVIALGLILIMLQVT